MHLSSLRRGSALVARSQNIDDDDRQSIISRLQTGSCAAGGTSFVKTAGTTGLRINSKRAWDLVKAARSLHARPGPPKRTCSPPTTDLGEEAAGGGGGEGDGGRVRTIMLAAAAAVKAGGGGVGGIGEPLLTSPPPRRRSRRFPHNHPKGARVLGPSGGFEARRGEAAAGGGAHRDIAATYDGHNLSRDIVEDVVKHWLATERRAEWQNIKSRRTFTAPPSSHAPPHIQPIGSQTSHVHSPPHPTLPPSPNTLHLPQDDSSASSSERACS